MLYEEISNRELSTANDIDKLYRDTKDIIGVLEDNLNVKQLAQMLINVRCLQDDLDAAIFRCMNTLQSITRETMEAAEYLPEWATKMMEEVSHD